MRPAILVPGAILLIIGLALFFIGLYTYQAGQSPLQQALASDGDANIADQGLTMLGAGAVVGLIGLALVGYGLTTPKPQGMYSPPPYATQTVVADAGQSQIYAGEFKFCTFCGSRMPKAAGFCPSCGRAQKQT